MTEKLVNVRCLLFTLFLLGGLLPSPGVAKPLVAEISSHEIMIHTAFEGTDLILFGARNEPGDIVVVVRGPERRAIIRRKEPVGGIWINRAQERFSGVPAFHALASSRPFEEITRSVYFEALGIDGMSVVTPFPGSGEARTPLRQEEFSRALLRYLKRSHLYSREAGEIKFIGDTLFKTTIHFPDNTPRGTYTAEAYLFSDGELTGVHTTPIRVVKSGFDAFIYDASRHYAYLYAMVAIGLATLFGWLAGYVFRRV